MKPVIKKKFTIIRDSREKKGKGWQFRSSANCDGVEVAKLDTGDYSIKGCEHLIMIERKTITDLWGSLIQGRERFTREMERAKYIPHRYLIIEATLSDIMKGIRYSKVKPQTILASLVSLEVKYGIHVIFTSKTTGIAQRYVRSLLDKLYSYIREGVIKSYV
jgi:ERCC4-type nuclease